MHAVPFPKEALEEMECKGAILHAPDGFEEWVEPMPIGINDNSLFILWKLDPEDLRNLDEMPVIVMQVHSHQIAPVNLTTVPQEEEGITDGESSPFRLQEEKSAENNGNASVHNLLDKKEQ